MSDRTLEAKITATDRASPIFRQVATGAETMGRSVTQAAQAGATSAERFNRAWVAGGIAAGTAAQLLGQWSRSAQDAAAIGRGLDQAIQNTGHSFDEYRDRIRAAGEQAVQLGIDDETAFQAIQRLTEQTGNAGTALDLLGTAEDLAASRGMDLSSAAQLLGRVYEGNTTILQRYGIIVQQGATAEQALAQIQQQVGGQAEAHATTYARLREELANVTDTIGGTVGGFAPFLAMLPGLSVGVTAATGAIGALVPEMTAATAASAALDLALGPVGIALAAGAAVVAIYELTKGHHDEAAAAKEAEQATKDLATTLANLNAAGSSQAGTATSWVTTLTTAVEQLGNEIDDTQKKLNKAMVPPQPGETVGDSHDLQIQLDELKHSAAEAAVAEKALNDILNDTGTGAGLAQIQLKQIFDTFAKNKDVGLLISSLAELGRHLGDLDVQANKLKETQEGLTRATDRQQAAQESWSKSIADATAEQLRSIAATSQQQVAQERLAKEMADAAADQERATARYWDTQNRQQQGAQEGLATQIQLAQAMHDQESALDRVARGSTSAAVQLKAFKDVQDGLLGQEDVFNRQYAEYGSQLDAISRAQDILNQRVADGIPLTKDQTDFLNNAGAASERLAAGQDDAAIAAGEAAVKYGENMSVGDKLNETLGGVTRTTGELTDAVELLIASLLGVPPETVAKILLEGANEAIDTLQVVKRTVEGLDGQTATLFVNTVQNTTRSSAAPGGGFEEGGRLGGVMGYALGGSIVPVELAEVGDELLHFRGGGTALVRQRGIYGVEAGTYVTTADATAEKMGGSGGGVTIIQNIREVNGFAGVEELMAAAARSARAHFAGMGA